jgi:hypothetical protein
MLFDRLGSTVVGIVECSGHRCIDWNRWGRRVPHMLPKSICMKDPRRVRPGVHSQD